MAYWLFKTEPDAFSIDDLKNAHEQSTFWEGVRNYQARNFIRDDMSVGDLALFYHSNCDEPGIVGIMEIVRSAYPDHTAFDSDEKYFDPKSGRDHPRWFMVDVRFKKKFRRGVLLKDIRAQKKLQKMRLIQRGNRLSILPVAKTEWNHILRMAGED